MKRIFSIAFFLFLFILSSGLIYAQTYTSITDGDWNSTSTWDGGVVPTASNSTAIIVNHNVTITADISIDQTTIQSGGSISIDYLVTLDILDGTGTDLLITNGTSFSLLDDLFFDGSFVNVYGQIINRGSINLDDNLSNLNYLANSTYQHDQNSENIPPSNWNSNSLCYITGVTTTAPGNFDQTFGDFRWACSSQSQNVVLPISNSSTVIAGDFSIENTSNRVLVFSTTNGVEINVLGNMNVTGNSRFSLATSNSTTLNVQGNFSINSTGTSSFLATTGTGILNVDGNFSHLASTFQGNSNSSVNFTGTSAQSFSSGGTFTNVNFNVNSGATLNLGSSVLSGGGNFTLNTGGTLRVGYTNNDGGGGAIQTGTTGGNLRVGGSRTWGNGSNIVYNGASAQLIGNGFPTSNDVNLEIDNSSGVSLNDNLDIASTLTLTSGNLNIGAYTLTLDGDIADGGAGGISGGPSSSLVIGGTGDFGTLTFAGTNQLLNFTLNRTASGLVTMGGDLQILGTFTHSNGALEIASNTLQISGDYSRTLGSIRPTANSTLIVDGAGSLDAFSFTGDQEFNTLTLDRDGATLSTGSTITINNLNLYSGTFANAGAGATQIAASGTITRQESGSMNNAPSAASSYNVVYDINGDISTGVELPTSTTALNNLTKDGGNTLTLSSDVYINGDLSLDNGTFNGGANTIDLDGDFISGATSSLTSSTFVFAGNTTLTGIANPTFGDVSVTGSFTPNRDYTISGDLAVDGNLLAGTGNVTFNNTSVISGTETPSFNDITISGTLTASGGSFNVAGDFINNGTFNNGSGTVVFNGTSSSISGSSTSNFHSIRIDNAGTLESPSTLNIAGNFENDGAFNHNDGTVVFNGGSAQSIGLNSDNPTTFYNIQANNNVNIEGPINLERFLTLGSSVTFDADGSGVGSFAILSSSVGTGGIAPIPSGSSISGNLTLQRFINESDEWAHIGFPFNGVSIAQLQNYFTISGTFTGASTGPGIRNNPSLFYYNEAEPGDLDQGWVNYPTSSNTQTITRHRGYTAWMRADATPSSANQTISAAGNMVSGANWGDVTLNLSYTSNGTGAGTNFISNPYPCAINWNSASITLNNVNDNAYVWDGTQYVLYGPVSGNDIIAPNQAFWVYATGGGASIDFTEDAKSANDAGYGTSFLRTGEEAREDVLIISLSDQQYTDEAYLAFRDNATDSFDIEMDVRKLYNNIFNLSTYTDSDSNNLVLNNLPFTSCSRSIGLDITNIQPGEYQLTFSNLDGFNQESNFILIDHFKNEEITVTNDMVHSFEVTSDESSYGNNRFEVVLLENDFFKPNISIEGNTLISSYQESNQWFRNGQLVEGANSSELSVEETGIYNLFTTSNDCASYSGDMVLYLSDSDQELSGCSNEFNLNLGQPNIGAYDLRFINLRADSSVVVMLIDTYTGQEININNGSQYDFSISGDTDSYGDSRFKIRIQKLLNAELSVDNNLLISNYATGNQWYKDGSIIEGETSQELEVTEDGVYHVEVESEGCTIKSREIEMVLRVTGLDSDNSKFNLYPNPVSHSFTINLPANLNEGEFDVLIYDNAGKLVISKHIKNNKKVSVDVSKLIDGYYTVVLNGESDTLKQFKIIKQ